MTRSSSRDFRDVRVLLGMDRPAAKVAVALFCLSFTVAALANLDGVHRIWPTILAAALVTAGATVIITVPGDPLPTAHTIALTALGPVACALVLWQLPVPGWTLDSAWQIRAVTVVLVYMSVRGRAAYAFTGAALMILTSGAWADSTGQGWGTGIRLASINLAPVLMSVFFAYSIRPLGFAVFRLRERESERAADEAMTQAVLRERDTQLTRLDHLARPILQASADGHEFSAGEREECAVLESRLRDTLRAPVFASDEAVCAAADSARRRGARVILLDDGGLADTPAETVTRIRAGLVDELDSCSDGTLTARSLPAGRDALATIVSEHGTRVRRVEYDRAGRVTVELRDDDDLPEPATLAGRG
ncbi:hypothetical protein FK531_09780 [Rhodococcus spelaei]|uniref:Uncharacterized protein n=1 Tax=Rhodococcus spelaei TaxID=2546320 RepID=A0A541B9P8_9NOCA|nr:hypothetical protein [Rhodococcus spelaei]TQF69061.1 hypothetical protein FK531_09780 [Rhodococcus spelaei]